MTKTSVKVINCFFTSINMMNMSNLSSYKASRFPKRMVNVSLQILTEDSINQDSQNMTLFWKIVNASTLYNIDSQSWIHSVWITAMYQTLAVLKGNWSKLNTKTKSIGNSKTSISLHLDFLQYFMDLFESIPKEVPNKIYNAECF